MNPQKSQIYSKSRNSVEQEANTAKQQHLGTSSQSDSEWSHSHTHLHRSTIDGKSLKYRNTHLCDWVRFLRTRAQFCRDTRRITAMVANEVNGEYYSKPQTDMIEQKSESKEMYSFDKIYANSSTLMSFCPSIFIEFPCVVLAEIAKNQTALARFA